MGSGAGELGFQLGVSRFGHKHHSTPSPILESRYCILFIIVVVIVSVIDVNVLLGEDERCSAPTLDSLWVMG